MALDNLISISFSPEEEQSLKEALTTIESIMAPKGVNLTQKQRQSYGRVRYEMEVWISKAYSYMQSHGHLVPAFIDMNEHGEDWEAHGLLNPLIDRMEAVLQTILDTNLLLGTDLYNNSMSFYRSVKVAARSNAQGAAAVYADLKQQFPGPKSKTGNNSTT